jgi:arabinogalactan oligomer/maltooligosaccharide transport system substrate-binding protein
VGAGCQPAADRGARLTVATSWGGGASESLHREILRVTRQLGDVTVEVRTFSFLGLADSLARGQRDPQELMLDLIVVPNDWLGPLAERQVIGELPTARIEAARERLVRQALLAVTDRDRVLGYPLSAEVLALVYDPARFAGPPATMEDILRAELPAGTLPFAFNIGSAYHLAPFVTSLQGPLIDAAGRFAWDGRSAAEALERLRPAWQAAGAWPLFAGSDVESMQLQFFAEGRLAAFLAGPWMLEALEKTGRTFAIAPVPRFAGSPHPAQALVGYQCVAVAADSTWADLALEVGARLLDVETNERLNQGSRRLPVLLEAYQSASAIQSPGAVGFLRALEEGQFFSASTSWNMGFQGTSESLAQLGRRREPPSRTDVAKATSRVTP